MAKNVRRNMKKQAKTSTDQAPAGNTTEDGPSLDDFRVGFNLGSRGNGQRNFLINSCIPHLESEFFKSVPASNAKASASDHDVAVLGAPARSIAIEETARLLAGTETPVSPVTRKVYEILKARRAGLKDYLPTVNHDVKTRKWNPEYSLLDALRRKARADKLGTRSSSSIKAFSTTSE